MMYLVIIFISPLYFFIRKLWGGFILNSILYCLAPLTVFFFGLGFIFWALGVGHAVWYLRKELMLEQAKLIATEMGKEMRKNNS